MHTVPPPTAPTPVDAISLDDDPFQPTGWDELIGQDRLKSTLRLRLDAAAEGVRFPGLLLTGPPGYGKTTVARLVANELGHTLHMTSGTVTEQQALNTILEHDMHGNTPPLVWFIDEAHQLPRKAQDALLPVTQDHQYQAPWGMEDCSWLTVIMATTDRAKIVAPLRDRLREPAFDPYSDGDLASIVLGMAIKVGLDLSPRDCMVFARAAGGVPRQARELVEVAQAFAATGRPIDPAEVLAECRITTDGFTKRHVDVLRVLRQLNGKAGVKLIADQLGITVADVEELERLLVRNGAITRSSTGRVLTAHGVGVVRSNPDL